jgi:transposase
MESVIGIDVSKSFSVASAFSGAKQKLETSLTFEHDNEGFSKFIQLAKRIEESTESKPIMVLEPTGHYHLVIMDLLEKQGYQSVLINPLISKRERSSATLRKLKTDVADADQLAKIYYRLDLTPTMFSHDELFEVRYSVRLHQYLTTALSAVKVKAKGVLDLTFPYFGEVFKSSFSKHYIQILTEFPSAKTVLKRSRDDIVGFVSAAYGYRENCKTVQTLVDKLINAALKCPVEKEVFDSHIHSLLILLKTIEEHQNNLEFLLHYITDTLMHRRDFQILKSIPGIGDHLAAAILCEIGDIHRFSSHKKLTAYAGIEPSVYQSGKFKAQHNHISKHGSRYLRRSLYISINCQIRGAQKWPVMREYYDLKRAEGKAHRAVVVACMNKLLRIIYALLTKDIMCQLN